MDLVLLMLNGKTPVGVFWQAANSCDRMAAVLSLRWGDANGGSGEVASVFDSDSFNDTLRVIVFFLSGLIHMLLLKFGPLIRLFHSNRPIQISLFLFGLFKQC
jgi:hypothetical protein